MKKTKLSKVAAVIAAGAACAAFGFAAVACGEEEHTHKWADAWTTNSTHHWHVCTAGDDCKDISGKDTHKDADEDGKCDTCNYTMSTAPVGHEHVWATVWSSDATDHWHACTVEGCTETNDKAAHGEANEDGKCPTCDKELGGGEEAVANTAKLTFADTTITVAFTAPSWAPAPNYITVYDGESEEIEGATDINLTEGTVLTLTQNWSDCSLYIYFIQDEVKKYSETLDSTRLLAGKTYALTLNGDDWSGNCFGINGAEAKPRMVITAANVSGTHNNWMATETGKVMTEVTPEDADVLQQFEIEITVTATDNFGLSLNGGTWVGLSAVDMDLVSEELKTLVVAGGDYGTNIKIAAAGTYKITLYCYEGYGNYKIGIIAA